MKYSHLLFDWDGCLAPTLDIWMEVYKETLATFGLFPEDLEIGLKVMGKSKGPLAVGLEENDLDEFYIRLRSRFSQCMDRLEIPQQTVSLVNKLFENGYKLAIVTSSVRYHVEEKITTYFPEVTVLVTQEDVSKIKPSPEPLLLAMEQLSALPEKTLMIGDSENDILAAKNAAIDSVLYFPKRHSLFYDLVEFKSYNPTYVISNFEELLDVID